MHFAAALLAAALALPIASQAATTPATTATTPAVQPRETFEVGMLRVERFGVAGRPPLIFVPALFCGSWQWNRELAALADRYDMYALTLPGFDGRARDRGGDLMTRAVADIATLITSRHLDRPVIIGHSLGGTLSVLFAETHPTMIRGVVSAEGGYPIAPTPELREKAVAESTARYQGIDQAALGPALRAYQLRYGITRPADADAMQPLAGRSDPVAIVDWMRAALLLDLTPGLSRISVPLEEIVPFDPDIDPYVGYSSFEAKRAAYQAWVAHAPQGTVAMVTPSRHFVMLDQPEEFDRLLYAAIRRFTSN